MKVSYLASPYSSPDPFVQNARFEDALKATAFLMGQGNTIYSPIVHCHPLGPFLPTGWEFWSRPSFEMLRRCDELIVLVIDGWFESVGVQAEIQEAAKLGMRISYLTPLDGGAYLVEG